MSLYSEGMPVVMVAASRLSWEPYDHARQRDGRRGDIDKAYSADIIAMQSRCKTFTHQGELYTNIGGRMGDAIGAYRLVLLKHYKGITSTYGERTRYDMGMDRSGAEAARNDPQGFYNSMRVKCGKDEFVMVGPELFFKADPSIPDYAPSESLFDLPDDEPEDEDEAEDYDGCEECGELLEACECDETIDHELIEPEPVAIELEDVEPVSVPPIATEPEQLGLF